MFRPLLIAALVPCVFSACAGTPVMPPPEPSPIVAVVPDEEEEEAPEPPPEESRLDGDEQLSERWRTPLRQWAAKDIGGIYERVVAASEVSNEATVLLMRHFAAEGAGCFVGPTTLWIRQDDGGDVTFEEEHWGSACCPGHPCSEPTTAIDWNLRYVNAIAAKDHAALAALLPAKGTLSWRIEAEGKSKTRKIARKAALAGALDDAAGCNFLGQRSECESIGPDSKAFRCQCLGGGSSATFDWKQEGGTWVLARIDESSH